MAQVLVLMPADLQVASVVTTQSPYWCAEALGMDSVSCLPQTAQVRVLMPFALQVASVVTTQSPNLWSFVFAMAVVFVTAPQTVQYVSWVPASAQVACFVTRSAVVWPFAGISSDLVSPQVVQV